MKKFLSLAVLAAAIGTAQIGHSVGVGLVYYYGWYNNGGVNDFGLSVKLGNFPVLGINLNINSGNIGLGANVDYWIVNNKLIGPIDWFFGVGGFGRFILGNNSFRLDAGARLPVAGLQWFVIKPLEIFIEGALAINILSIGTGANGPLNFSYGPAVAAGFRIHF